MVCFFSAGRGKKQRNLRIAALLFFWGGGAAPSPKSMHLSLFTFLRFCVCQYLSFYIFDDGVLVGFCYGFCSSRRVV